MTRGAAGPAPAPAPNRPAADKSAADPGDGTFAISATARWRSRCSSISRARVSADFRNPSQVSRHRGAPHASRRTDRAPRRGRPAPRERAQRVSKSCRYAFQAGVLGATCWCWVRGTFWRVPSFQKFSKLASVSAFIAPSTQHPARSTPALPDLDAFLRLEVQLVARLHAERVVERRRCCRAGRWRGTRPRRAGRRAPGAAGTPRAPSRARPAPSP